MSFEDNFGKPENPKEKREQERNVEQDKKMRFSGELVERPILDGEPGYDKIFLMGEVTENDHEWTIDIKSDTPTVALDQKIKEEFDLTDSPTIEEAREGKAGNLTLLSGGAHLWLHHGGKSELILIRRDMGAKVDAGYLTGPAGRCGEAPSLTGLNETNEELIIVKSLEKGREHFRLLGFYGDESQREAVVHQKLRQVKHIYDHLMAKGREADAKLLGLIRGEDDIETYSTMQTKRRIENSDKIYTRVDGKVVDVLENGIAFMDKKTNTLEMREIIDVNLPEHTEIAQILDGEVWGRDIVRTPDLESIAAEQKVAALENYYQRIREGSL